VERAIAVLKLFESAEPDLGITEIAHRADLRVSTAHRIVTALRHGGLLERDPSSERYRLGVGMLTLGRRASDVLGIPRFVPGLEALAAATGESVNLGIRSGAEIVVVHRIASSHPLRFDQEPGSRVPIYASAMGKALLAACDDPPREVKSLGQLQRLTRQTESSKALVDDLEAVAARGWSLNDEERNVGVRAVGAAILDTVGRPIAAIAVQGPAVRLTDARIRELGPIVAGAAREMSRLSA
jgi:DNA-binding IclR family transcriptional regulator